MVDGCFLGGWKVEGRQADAGKGKEEKGERKTEVGCEGK